MIASMKTMLVLVAALQICFLVVNVEAYQALLCEGTYLPLACPPDSYISISSAFFGRRDTTTCPHDATAMTNVTNCTAPQAMAVVQGLCEGRQSCDVGANTFFFTDPCSGVFKYLSFQYSCMACVNNLGDDAACDQRALKGDCVNNATYMIANCAKSCYKCESYIAPGCMNVYADVNCTQWAAAGQCQSNPSFMIPYCKSACAGCDAPTPCVNNYGNDTMCDLWYQNSQCTTNNSDWMLGQCGKSCFKCNGTIQCKNQNTQCDFWALKGYCQDNPGFMIALCTQSCLECTVDPVLVDSYSQCVGWAAARECVINPIWMYKNCWKSCIQINKTNPVCANNASDAYCEAWAKNGQCDSNPGWMHVQCRQACYKCKAYSGGPPNCVNTLGNDTQCNVWSNGDQCGKNPAYMFNVCYQTCTGCSGSTYYISRAGYAATPGLGLAQTNGYSQVIPFYFPTSAIVYQFSAYFISTNPVHLQIWRPTGTSPVTFSLVYDYLYTPPMANIATTIQLPTCWLVNYGDQFGFTSIVGTASISYTTDSGFQQIAVRQAISGGSFTFTWSPIDFSLAAQFYPATTC